MPVTTKFSGMTNTAIVQFDNSVKGLAVSTIEQGNIDKIISAKKDITPTDTSTGKLIDNINMYEVGDFKIEHDAILTPVETIYGDQLVSAIKDVSTVITIHKDLSDEAVNWNKDLSKTEHYVEFPLNGRPATWLDLIKYQSWYMLAYGTEYMGSSVAEQNNILHKLWNSATSYTVTRIGYYYFDTVDGLYFDFTDMDPFENITMNKYQELRNIMINYLSSEHGFMEQTDWEDEHEYIEFVFEACFNGITDSEVKKYEGIPHIGGVIRVRLEPTKNDYNENPNKEIPLYAFQFIKKQLLCNTNTLGFNYYKSGQRCNFEINESSKDTRSYELNLNTIIPYDYANNSRTILLSAPILQYTNIITNNFKKRNNITTLFLNAQLITFTNSVDGISGGSLAIASLIDKSQYSLCIFSDPYTENTYRLLSTNNIDDLVDIARIPNQSKYKIRKCHINYEFHLEPEFDYAAQYIGIAQNIEQYPVLFGGCIEFNKNITYDGKTNSIQNYYDDFIRLIVIPQSINGMVVPRPPADLQDGFGFNQTSWIIPKKYTGGSANSIIVPPMSITSNDGTMIYHSYQHDISYKIPYTSDSPRHLEVAKTLIYLFGKIPYVELQKSNACVTINLQNIKQSSPIQTQTVQKINFFFKDFTIGTELPSSLQSYNLRTTFCADVDGFYVYLPNLWKTWTNRSYDSENNVPIAIYKAIKNYDLYGESQDVIVAVYYWYVGSAQY